VGTVEDSLRVLVVRNKSCVRILSNNYIHSNSYNYIYRKFLNGKTNTIILLVYNALYIYIYNSIKYNDLIYIFIGRVYWKPWPSKC
jgi:hypothetical protein